MIKRSLDLAGIDPADVGVRLRLAGGQVRPRFVAKPEAGDEVVHAGGIRVFIAASLKEAYGDVEVGVTAEHEQLTVRPLR